MPTNPRAKIETRQGPWIVASMRRNWLKERLDKQTDSPTIHQSLEAAFAAADAMAAKRSRGHFAVFECIGFIRLGKPKRKKPIACD